MRRRAIDRDGLARELAGLPDLPLDALKQRWRDLYRCDPPKKLGRRLLVRAIAYKLQEHALGSLKPAVGRILDKTVEDIAHGKEISVAPPAIKAGTRLLREWRGETHEVILLDDGVLYRGERLRSLTEVARTITGVHWNGPRFFGLRSKKKEDAHAAP